MHTTVYYYATCQETWVVAPVAIPQKRAAGLAALLVFVLASPSEAAQITAADFDDNLNFSYYLDYKNSPFSGAAAMGMPNLSLEDRVTIRLTDAGGRPVSNALVVFTPQAQSGSAIRLIAGNDGVVRFFPTYDGAGNASSFTMDVIWPGEQRVAVSASLNLATLNPEREYTLTLQNQNAALPSALDAMFLIDTTGSMGDEIAYLRSEFANITAAVAAGHPSVDTRFGLVVYRDNGDDYVSHSYGFTGDATQMQGWLRGLSADGGGDMPEAMDVGLASAVAEEWRAGNTARVMFLVADAPTHATGYAPFIATAGDARRAGIHIFPVAASGTERYAQYLLRAAEVLTQGRYIFLTDDSGIGNAHATPLVPCFVVTPLAGLMTRVVASELSGARVEPPTDAIIRTVGNYSAGRCEEQGQMAKPASGTPDGTQPEPTEPEPTEPVAEPKVTTVEVGASPGSESTADADLTASTTTSGTSGSSSGGSGSAMGAGMGSTATYGETAYGPPRSTEASPETGSEGTDVFHLSVPPAPVSDSATAGAAIGSMFLGLFAAMAVGGVGLSAVALRHRRRK